MVQVVALRGALCRARHARRVAPDDEEGRAADPPRLGVELHLRRPGVDHRRRPDRHDRRLLVQHTLLNHRLVLLDAHVERHVRGLRPAAERREPQHGVAVPPLLELALRVSHQERVPGVRRVARLEGEDGVGVAPSELAAQLVHREPELVEAVVVLDLAKQLDLSAHEPVARRADEGDVRVIGILHTEAARDDLLLPVLIHLRVAHNRERLAGRVVQSDGVGLLDLPLGEVGDRQDYGHGHGDAHRRVRLGVQPIRLPLDVPRHPREVVRVDDP
mmetsp:Transcript_13385/g.34856  ORF Transcript_13385/g.34856 Transcript_13385/m.34856 type:complete len:274 (-) Transcript_13385:1295-2116(-)